MRTNAPCSQRAGAPVWCLAAGLLLALAGPDLVLAQEASGEGAKVDSTQAPPLVENLGSGRYRIGSVELDRAASEIYLTGEVNMDSGLVELFACGPRGKLHESVLRLDVSPHHLQVALLLIGLTPGGGVEFQGDPSIPTGDPVEIWVEWEVAADGDGEATTVRRRAEDLVYNMAADAPMARTPFVFVGSQVVDGVFVAEVEQSIITTYHDPYTILDNPLPTGGDDTLYAANYGVVPARGTPVRVTLKAVPPTGVDAKPDVTQEGAKG